MVALSLLLAVVLATILVLCWTGYATRYDQILLDWAAGNAYRIVEQHRLATPAGPFLSTSTRAHVLYRIVVEDERGHLRRGWARCLRWFWGVISDQVEVCWDDQE